MSETTTLYLYTASNPARHAVLTAPVGEGSGWTYAGEFKAFTTPQDGTVALHLYSAKDPERHAASLSGDLGRGWSHDKTVYVYPAGDQLLYLFSANSPDRLGASRHNYVGEGWTLSSVVRGV